MTHLRAFVDTRDFAIPDDVSDVRDDLCAERDEEPDWIDVLEAVPDVLEAGDLAQREERRQREQGGAEEEQGGLCPRPVDIAFRLDVQVTQVRILR
jgi:hypothetical protein